MLVQPARVSRFLLLPLLGALLLPACIVHEHRADARFYWTFAGRACAEAGVDLVQVVVEELGGSDYADTGLLDCRDGSVELHDLHRGDYRVTALGFAPIGSYPTWDFDRDIHLFGGYNELTLDMVPAGSL